MGNDLLDRIEEFPMENSSYEKEEILDYVKNSWHFRARATRRDEGFQQRKGV
jgi:hypothetical protein